MIRVDVREVIGQYRSGWMNGNATHRNGSYKRISMLKGIGEVDIRVPRDHKIITPTNLYKIEQMSRIDYTTGRFIGFSFGH
jgi:transposase-like protein